MTKRESYHQVVDGEWIEIAMTDFREMCCDCGLVHTVDFRKRGRKFEMRARRDERATAAARRGKKRNVR